MPNETPKWEDTVPTWDDTVEEESYLSESQVQKLQEAGLPVVSKTGKTPEDLLAGMSPAARQTMAARPEVPIVTPLAEKAALGARSLAGEVGEWFGGEEKGLAQRYRELEEEEIIKKQAVRGEFPKTSLATDIVGGMALPGGAGGVLRGSGVAAGQMAGDAFIRTGDIGEAAQQGLMAGAAGAGLGGVVKSAGKAIDTARLRQKGIEHTKRVLDPDNMLDKDLTDTAAKLVDSGIIEEGGMIKSKQALADTLERKRKEYGKLMESVRETTETTTTRGSVVESLREKAQQADELGLDDKANKYRKVEKAMLKPETRLLNAKNNKISNEIVVAEKNLSNATTELNFIPRDMDILQRDLAEKQLTLAKALKKSKGKKTKRVRLIELSIDRVEQRIGKLNSKQSKLENLKEKLSDKLETDQFEFAENASRLDDIADESFNLKALLSKKKELQDKAKYEGPIKGADKEKQEVARVFQEIEDDVAPELIPLKEGYGQISEGLNALKKPLQKEKPLWKEIGTEYGVPGVIGATAGAALGVGALPGAATALVGRQVWKKYGDQLMAAGFSKRSKILSNQKWADILSSAADKLGGKGVSTAHMLLMRRDPEYQKQYMKEQEEKKNEAE